MLVDSGQAISPKARGDSLRDLLNTFALENLLRWIEIVCLLDCLSEGVTALRRTIESLKISFHLFQ